jgi:YfiH family protein
MSTRLGAKIDNSFGMNFSYKVGDKTSIVTKNRKIFFSQLGISLSELAIPHQCHSDIVRRVDAPGEYYKCDGLITNIQHVALVITIADCVPILLYDPIQKAIGAIHAGWKGTASSIVERAVERMKQEYKTDPSHLLAFIGPSAGVCCYEVGEEVAVMFGNKVVTYHSKNAFIDLKEENKLQLQEQGVQGRNIEVSKHCTICEKQLFHSYRRDGKKAGRMIATICIM